VVAMARFYRRNGCAQAGSFWGGMSLINGG
jgi:hypothetical protein